MRNKNVGVGVANTNSIAKDATKSIILVRMMNEEKRFVCIDIGYGDEWYITDNGERLSEMEIVDLLNKQQDTIITLKRRLEKINGGYGLLVHRNGLTANEWVIESQERELKKKNEQISDWIKQHSKDIVKIGEQQAIIKRLEEENEWLKQQLLYEGDDVCSICKHEYLVPSGNYFISKCKKEHKECSKKDIKYCEDFELIQADFEDLIKRMDKEFKE